MIFRAQLDLLWFFKVNGQKITKIEGFGQNHLIDKSNGIQI